MEKYEDLILEIIFFETVDIITGSDPNDPEEGEGS